MFLAEDLQQLAEDVDYFSLMTYDYSSPARPGPNSPVQWVRRYVPVTQHDIKLLFLNKSFSEIPGIDWLPPL
jgi:chitinase domain-containing protein 1